MKKQLTLQMFSILLVLLISMGIKSQSITNYAFSATSGSFTPIVGGTPVSTAVSSADFLGDEKISVPIPIGFDFIYMGRIYNSVVASSNGFLSFNLNATATSTNNLSGSDPTTRPLVAPLWDDLDGASGSGAANYKTEGTVGSRIFTIEWLNWQWNWSATGTTISFQVKLYEATSAIEFVYRDEGGAVNSGSASIGITAIATGAGNFLSLDGTGTSPNVSSTVETNSLSTKPATGQIYTFTPPAIIPAAPTNLIFTGVSGTTMTLNWTDNATNESGYSIYRSTDGVNYSFITSLAANATTYNATGLSFGTTYYWRIYAFNEGKISNVLEGSQATNPGTISGNKTIGPTGDYPSLTAAFNDINTNGLTASVNLILQSNYVSTVETFPIVPSNSTITSSTRTITIYPAASGLAIEGDHATAIFNFDNSDYIIIDGRVNATGTIPNLILRNTNTSGATLQFINSATYNNIKYCKIEGAYYNTIINKGVVTFATDGTGPFGNSNNIIEYNDIYPIASATNSNCLIYSNSNSAAFLNKNNIIRYNNIFDYRASATISGGIYLANNTSDWIINNNSFYQTAMRNTSSAVYGIYISNTTNGNNFLISNNYIGGTQPMCSGSSQIYANSNPWLAIYASVGTVGKTIIENNVIQNIDITSFGSSTSFGGIRVLNGKYDIVGNIIGSDITINSIRLNLGIASARFYGIITGTGSTGNDEVLIENNKIGGISLNSTVASGIILLQVQSSGATANHKITIKNNLFGSLTMNNSVTTNTNQALNIIYAQGGSSTNNIPVNIINNTIANISVTNTGTATSLTGILAQGSGSSPYFGKYTIKGNKIFNLNSEANANVIAINKMTNSNAGEIIDSNYIYNISNNNATATSAIRAIQASFPNSGANYISRNKINNLNNASSGATVEGIYTSMGFYIVENNMIALGNTNNQGTIRGINQFLGSGVKFYHNSVYIGGNASSGSANTFAMDRNQTSSPADFFNNIFVNYRTGNGKHYAMKLGGTSDYTTPWISSNYNIFDGDISQSNNMFLVAGTDYNFSNWKTITNFENNSFVANPQFIAPTNINPDLHINSTIATPVEGKGLLIPSVIIDYDGDIRANFTPTDIGADAGNFTPMPVYDIATIGMIAPTSPLCAANNKIVTVTIKNLSNTLIDFATKNVIVGVNVLGASTQNFSTVINSGTLAVNDTLNVNVTSNCNLTAAGSHIFSCYALIADDVNTANDTLASKTVIVNPLPVAVTSLSVNNNTICSNAGGTITLAANGGSGTTLNWFTSSCGGTHIGSGTPLSIPVPTFTTKYYARWETASCGVSDCDSITVTVLPLPTATATPTGPTILPVNSANTNYTTAGATNATTYEWLLSPASAGTISGTGLTGTVDWNNTFSGQAEISVVAWNNNCPGDTSDVLIVTLTSPVMTTLAASNVSSNGATLNGSINPNGLIVRDIVFQYGLTTSYTHSIAPTIDTATGNMVINFSADATGLTPNTTYHYRIFGKVNNIVFTGSDLTFTTNILVPQFNVTFVVTDGSNPINGATVTLSGYGTQTTNASGIAIFNNVDSNTVTGYNWTVTATGYTTQTGNVLVNSNKTVNVTMPLITYTVTFNVTDGTNPIQGATVTLTGYGNQTTNAGGVAIFNNVAPAASIAWTVVKTGYTTQTGNVNVSSNQTVNVIMPVATYTVTFNVTDGTNPIQGATVTLTGYGNQTTNASGVAVFTNVSAAPAPGIAYSVSKLGYNTSNGNVIVDGNKTVNVTLTHSYYDVVFYVFDNITNTPWTNIPVVVVGQSIVNTNASGIAVFSLIMGNYNYEVRFSNDTIAGSISVPVLDTVKIPYHVGIFELGNVQFEIYPNPVKEKINISANELMETVKLIDINGKAVLVKKQIGSKMLSVDVANLPKGNYFILVETSKGKGIRKMQIIR